MKSFLLLHLLFLSTSSASAFPLPQFLPFRRSVIFSPTSGPFTPKVKSATLIGIAADDYVNRDSCASARFGDRILWTCRDSQQVNDGTPYGPIISSTASWTDLEADGSIKISGDNKELRMYGAQPGDPFFPIQPDSCPKDSSGFCGDFTRYAIWPDVNPFVTTSSSDGSATAYTWIRKQRITMQMKGLTHDPETTLYRISYTPSTSTPHDALPSVSVVSNSFWQKGDFSYGNYGGAIRGDVAYLFGQASNDIVGLARVPVSSIEDSSAYEFYVDNEWTHTKPNMNDTRANIPHASAGGEGTYYFDARWQRFVWIGQAKGSVWAKFWITTAPAAEGPWEQPVMFHEAESGSYALGAYSLYAHPGLVREGERAMVIGYTKNDWSEKTRKTSYTNPLIRIEWDN